MLMSGCFSSVSQVYRKRDRLDPGGDNRCDGAEHDRGCATSLADGDCRFVAGAGSVPPAPSETTMKTGDLAGPDRCLGTNPRTRPTPAGYRTFPSNFAPPDGGLPRICARKISAL